MERLRRRELTLALVEGPVKSVPRGFHAEVAAVEGSGLLLAALPLWRFAATLHALRCGDADPIGLSHVPEFIEAIDDIPAPFLAKPAGAARIREAVEELVDPRPVVLEAENGLRALYVLRERRVDLVVADWEMPVLDGVDMAERLRGDSRFDRIPLVALTGHDTEEPREDCIAAGFDHVLVKPVRRDELVACVDGLLIAGAQATGEVVLVDPDIEDLVPAYLSERREEIPILRGAVDDGDAERCRRIGHSLKGTGGAYGFQRLTDLGARLEEAGQREDMEDCAASVDAIEGYLATVRVRYAS